MYTKKPLRIIRIECIIFFKTIQCTYVVEYCTKEGQEIFGNFFKRCSVFIFLGIMAKNKVVLPLLRRKNVFS